MKKILGATALSIALGASALAAAPAQAGSAGPAGPAAPVASADGASALGNTSLAEVLGEDGTELDNSFKDFDIAEAAILAVIDANPDSPVGLLADGKVRLTAFVPTDKAFQILVKDLTGKKRNNEKMVFRAVANLGIETVEDVLLYHVVPGKTLTSARVLEADGVELGTALPDATVRVDVKGKNSTRTKVLLHDNDHNSFDPGVKILDINRGNKQIAHGINKVLRPIDL